MHLPRKLNVHMNGKQPMAMADEGITSNNSLKIRLAYTFIRALGRIKRQGPAARYCKSAPPSTFQSRRRRIKLAAYTSMASAVGYHKYSWSRAVLARRLNRRSSEPPRLDAMGRKKQLPRRPRDAAGRTEKLRQLVPGGESMDVCTLLDETANFIMCLEAQVQVMQSVLHGFSK